MLASCLKSLSWAFGISALAAVTQPTPSSKMRQMLQSTLLGTLGSVAINAALSLLPSRFAILKASYTQHAIAIASSLFAAYLTSPLPPPNVVEVPAENKPLSFAQLVHLLREQYGIVVVVESFGYETRMDPLYARPNTGERATLHLYDRIPHLCFLRIYKETRFGEDWLLLKQKDKSGLEILAYDPAKHEFAYKGRQIPIDENLVKNIGEAYGAPLATYCLLNVDIKNTEFLPSEQDKRLLANCPCCLHKRPE